MTEQQRIEINDFIGEIARGREYALDALYQIVGGRMLSVAISVVKNRFAAEDVVQESFVKIVKYAPRFKKDTNGYAWICKIVQNTALNYLRREKRFTADDIDSYYNLSAGCAEFELSALSLTVEKAMGCLTEKEKKIIYAKYFMDFTVREIAKSVGISKSSVQRIVDCAEEKIKNFLNERDG